MPILLKSFALAACCCCLLSSPGWATTLLGTNVTGSITYGVGSTNYFNPANGFVPAGFLNTAGTTVTIQNPAVEFGYQDLINKNTADFTDTAFTFTDQTVGQGSTSIHMSFTDPAFAGLTLTRISDSFPNGGLTYSLVGSTITLNDPGFGSTNPLAFQASFSLTPAAVPEPSSYVLFSTVLLGITPLLRRKRRLSKRG